MNEATRFFKHAKTFSLASHILPQDVYQDILILYQFCRTMDDLCDTPGNLLEVKKKLSDVKEALITRTPQQVAPFIHMIQRRHIASYYPLKMLEAFTKDLDSYAISSVEEFLDYSLCVASTVGVMLCKIIGIQNTQALPYAIDLGIAMQWTNIVRDMQEDAAHGKIFVPPVFFPKNFLEPDHQKNLEKITQRQDEQALSEVKERVISYAERFYHTASRGYRFLPWRPRVSFAAAATMYRHIGFESVHRGKIRAHVSKAKTVCLAATSLLLPMCPQGPAAMPDIFYEPMIAAYKTL